MRTVRPELFYKYKHLKLVDVHNHDADYYAEKESDGTVRPGCLIDNREQFFSYHRHLVESGVETGEIGGTGGRPLFHFYDPDGNRLNVGHC